MGSFLLLLLLLLLIIINFLKKKKIKKTKYKFILNIFFKKNENNIVF